MECYTKLGGDRSINHDQHKTSTSINNINQTTVFIQRQINITLLLLIIVIVSQKSFFGDCVLVCFPKLVFHGISSLAKQQ